MPIRPHQASEDEGFGIRVTRVALHGVAEGPFSTRCCHSPFPLEWQLRRVVERDPSGRISGAIKTLDTVELPVGEVTIRARWSSLNYKDALAATGSAGVVRKFPHVPGIDVAGEIVGMESADPTGELSLGDEAMVTGFDLGAGRWGGWSQVVRVPSEWVVKRPPGLSLRGGMVLGTAGFTAALSVDKLIQHGISPAGGDVVVTGATGGVGCLAVKLLARLGYV